MTAADALRAAGHPIGDVYLSRAELAARVAELASALATTHAGRDPVLVAPLKASTLFLADLSRGLGCDHSLDFVELAPYVGGRSHGGVRLLKDLDQSITGRHVVIVADVVDTGMTLSYLARTFSGRHPASLSAVTLLDRPYRRLVEDVPVAHTGFVVPDELYAGYGLGLDGRWRALPDLHVVLADQLPAALSAA